MFTNSKRLSIERGPYGEYYPVSDLAAVDAAAASRDLRRDTLALLDPARVEQTGADIEADTVAEYWAKADPLVQEDVATQLGLVMESLVYLPLRRVLEVVADYFSQSRASIQARVLSALGVA